MDAFQGNALQNFYTKLRGGDKQALTRRMLDELGVTLQCHLPDLERIPKTGAAVIVCNHTYGTLEGKKLLAQITELHNICIWVDPIADRSQCSAPGSLDTALFTLRWPAESTRAGLELANGTPVWRRATARCIF